MHTLLVCSMAMHVTTVMGAAASITHCWASS
jgi:hypothetical protein